MTTSTTPTPAPRIRWEPVDGTIASWFGFVGSVQPPPFQVLHPVSEADDGHLNEWALCVTFIGGEVARYASTRDPEKAVAELKAEAEHWLEEFVSSLGAIFPAPAFEFPDDEGEPLEVKWAAGRRVRYIHPDAGYPGEAEEAAEALILGAVYTIGWADIGQSRTDLNLQGLAGRFNSVFFEPVDDEPAVTAGREEE